MCQTISFHIFLVIDWVSKRLQSVKGRIIYVPKYLIFHNEGTYQSIVNKMFKDVRIVRPIGMSILRRFLEGRG